MSLGPSCWLVYSSTEVPGSFCLSPLHELFSPWTTLHNLLHLVAFSPSFRSPPSENPSFIFTLQLRSKSSNKGPDHLHVEGCLFNSLQCPPLDLLALRWQPPLECELDLVTCLYWIQHGEELSLPRWGYLNMVVSILLSLSCSFSLFTLSPVRKTSSHVCCQ